MTVNFKRAGFVYAQNTNTYDTENAWENWVESKSSPVIPERGTDEWAEAADEFGTGFIDGINQSRGDLFFAVNALTSHDETDLDEARELIGAEVWKAINCAGDPPDMFNDWIAQGDYRHCKTAWDAVKQVVDAATLWNEMTDATA